MSGFNPGVVAQAALVVAGHFVSSPFRGWSHLFSLYWMEYVTLTTRLFCEHVCMGGVRLWTVWFFDVFFSLSLSKNPRNLSQHMQYQSISFHIAKISTGSKTIASIHRRSLTNWTKNMAWLVFVFDFCRFLHRYWNF